MPHSSEVTWGEFAQIVSGISEAILRIINDGEEKYQDMLEVFQYAGATDQKMANLLHAGDPNATDVSPELLAKTEDLKAAMQAIHQLYLCMTNGTVSQSDRAAALRRMS